MSIPEQKAKTELTSWKEIADYLGVSQRTAQRYEAELGLPVRRIGGEKGRSVVIRIEDLDAWKKRAVPPPRRWWNWLTSPACTTLGGVLLAATVGFFLRDFYERFIRGEPRTAVWDGFHLRVRDEHNHELWRYSFPDPYLNDAPSSTWIGDLDRDGAVEVLAHYNRVNRDAYGTSLYCFSKRGALLWILKPDRVVSDSEKTFTNTWVLRSFKVFPSPEGDGTSWLVGAFVHHFDYPAVVLIADSRGKVRSEYWHSGHFWHVESTDIDNDRIEDILLAGVDHGVQRATLTVLDPRAASGAQVMPPQHPKQLLGFSPAHEKAVVHFGRSRINEAWGDFNWADRITLPNESIVVEVVESHPRPERGYLIYVLDRSLRLRSVMASDALRNFAFQEHLAGRLKKPFDGEDIRELTSTFQPAFTERTAARTP